jgi:hypothetical protein
MTNPIVICLIIRYADTCVLLDYFTPVAHVPKRGTTTVSYKIYGSCIFIYTKRLLAY